MKKFLVLLLVCFVTCYSFAGYQVQFDFETGWSGDYAPGWENSSYRHGAPPVGEMMQQTTTAHSGSYGMKLIADSTPQSWMWWAGVNPIDVNNHAMQKQYNPYFSAWYYDDLSVEPQAGQIYAVPSWVNPYIAPGEDWTDIQFGGRYNNTANYYQVAVGQGHPGWQDTGIVRTAGWHQLKMQLNSADGHVYFYVDGNYAGKSYRSDYEDLITLGLYTQFQAPLADWTEKPYTIWDDVEFGSSYVPAPGALLLTGIGTALVGRVRRRL